MAEKNGEDKGVEPSARSSAGLGFASLVIGLLAGGAVYAIGEYWIDPAENKALAITTLAFVWSYAAAWLLLAEPGDFIRPIFAALIIAGVMACPSYYLASQMEPGPQDLAEFPAVFWFMVSGPLAFYLMATLIKATMQSGAPPSYPSVFFHGLTLPLIAGGAKLFAGLALLLLFAWAKLLKSLDVSFFEELFSEPYFIWPFLGAIAGLAVAMMRGQQSVLGALRYILLLFSRIAMPIMAVFSITLLLVIAIKGPGVVFSFAFPAYSMVGLALAGMLIFNGVYQNGEGAPPASWLRISSLISLAVFPVYAGLAAYAIWVRVGEYGLTPPRIAGLAITSLTLIYSIVGLLGFISDFNWRAKKWMPIVAPLNTAMAALWVISLLVLSSPVINSWALSAKSQEARLAEEKISAEEFDFGYMQFKLGRYGQSSLARLYQQTAHPEAAKIRAEIDAVRDAENIWDYRNPSPPIPTEENDAAADGPMGLELNPKDAPPDPDGDSQ